jgi:hypothetical protein
MRALAAAGGEATAAAGNEGRWSSPAGPQTRVLVHELKRGLHPREAREAARQSRVAVSAETQRHGRSTRRRGSARVAKSGEVPRLLQCTKTMTSDAGGFLTSLRVSGCAP